MNSENHFLSFFILYLTKFWLLILLEVYNRIRKSIGRRQAKKAVISLVDFVKKFTIPYPLEFGILHWV